MAVRLSGRQEAARPTLVELGRQPSRRARLTRTSVGTAGEDLARPLERTGRIGVGQAVGDPLDVAL